jgi:hypothetical protein
MTSKRNQARRDLLICEGFGYRWRAGSRLEAHVGKALPQCVEVESPREIRRKNSDLDRRLRRTLATTESRTIGSPSGNFPSKVRFAPGSGDDILYWTGRLSKDGRKKLNIFGHGSPGANNTLNIDVQFNLPVVSFSRRTGGAFLHHVPTGKTFLAHRGIATLGHGRISKAALLHAMAKFLGSAKTSKGVRDFLFICDLESPKLMVEIDAFSRALRNAVKSIKAHVAKARIRRHSNHSPHSLSGRLRKYYSEFSGETQVRGRKGYLADTHHGDVVEAIKRKFGVRAKTLKNQAIDLTVIMHGRIVLFEVKTSARPQSVYTAIGQLTAHAPAVAAIASGRRLLRAMVLPERPRPSLGGLMEQSLDIALLTFSRSIAGRITVHGLEALI